MIGSDQITRLVSRQLNNWKRKIQTKRFQFVEIIIDPIITFEKKNKIWLFLLGDSSVSSPVRLQITSVGYGLGSAAPDVFFTIKNEFTDEKIIII